MTLGEPETLKVMNFKEFRSVGVTPQGSACMCYEVGHALKLNCSDIRWCLQIHRCVDSEVGWQVTFVGLLENIPHLAAVFL